ncbi:MAG: GGDEF domain-containing protein [Nevskia sp.]|nr:GGDEF domain-containing protein [Nevskia sp.]
MTDETEDVGDLQKVALLDLGKRVASGTFVYFVIWLTISFACGLQHAHRLLVLVNALLFLLVALLRTALLRGLPALAENLFPLARAGLIGIILLSALHWGVLTAMSIHLASLAGIRMPMVIVACGIAGAAAGTMAVSPVLRYLFPGALLITPLVAVLLDFSAANALIAALSCIYVIYVGTASKVVNTDYWNALTNRLLLEQRARQLEELSITDALTGLRNRLYFDAHFDAEWRRACRQRQPVAILLVDLDHFKRVNDSYGHAFGDQCLKAAARAAQAEIQRTGDVLARYGGEEFIAVLGNTDGRGAAAVAERLRARVAGLQLQHGGQPVSLTCSIGLASVVPATPEHGFRLINSADQALYQAKRLGRNRVETYSAEAAPASA